MRRQPCPLTWLLTIVCIVAGYTLVGGWSVADTVVYQRTDGTKVTFVPADDRYPVDNKPVDTIKVLRPGGAQGDWVPLVTGPVGWALPMTMDGWIDWTIPAAQVYVSALTGKDTAAGTAAAPLKTLAKAATRLPRNAPWCLWLKGRFTEPVPALPNTGTPASPCLVHGWGERAELTSGIALTNVTGLGLVDLIITGPHNGSGRGVKLYQSSYVAVEDCLVQGWQSNVTCEAADGNRSQCFFVYRSTIVDAADTPANAVHSQGMYVHNCRGYLAEGCLLDSNGWASGRVAATQFNHNDYTTAENDDCEIRNVISANASATGWQDRSGGNVTWYVSINNPVGMTYGIVHGAGQAHPAGATGTLAHLVFDGGRDISASEPRGAGLNIGDISRADLSDIYFVHGTNSVNAAPIVIEKMDPRTDAFAAQDVGVNNLTFQRLWAFDWPRPAIKSASINGLVSLQSWVPGLDQSAGAAKRCVGVTEYAKSIGLADAAALVKAARGQSRYNWRRELTARAICEWVEDNSR